VAWKRFWKWYFCEEEKTNGARSCPTQLLESETLNNWEIRLHITIKNHFHEIKFI